MFILAFMRYFLGLVLGSRLDIQLDFPKWLLILSYLGLGLRLKYILLYKQPEMH